MYVLEVLCNNRDFYSYWYGSGELVDVEPVDGSDRFVFVVNYGEDGYRAEYQRDRFLSGLIPSEVTIS